MSAQLLLIALVTPTADARPTKVEKAHAGEAPRSELLVGLRAMGPLPMVELGWRQRWTPRLSTTLRGATIGVANLAELETGYRLLEDGPTGLGLRHRNLVSSNLVYANVADVGVAFTTGSADVSATVGLDVGVAHTHFQEDSGDLDFENWVERIGVTGRAHVTLDVALSERWRFLALLLATAYEVSPVSELPVIPELSLGVYWSL